MSIQIYEQYNGLLPDEEKWPDNQQLEVTEENLFPYKYRIYNWSRKGNGMKLI